MSCGYVFVTEKHKPKNGHQNEKVEDEFFNSHNRSLKCSLVMKYQKQIINVKCQFNFFETYLRTMSIITNYIFRKQQTDIIDYDFIRSLGPLKKGYAGKLGMGISGGESGWLDPVPGRQSFDDLGKLV